MATTKAIPPNIAKHFNTTAKAKKLMDPEGRICELETKSHNRELVYNTVKPSKYTASHWDEMSWSQATLYQAAQQDLTMRISRKAINGNTNLEIFTRDVFNSPEREKYANKPNMDSSICAVTLGYAQCRRNYVYIISKKTGA